MAHEKTSRIIQPYPQPWRTLRTSDDDIFRNNAWLATIEKQRSESALGPLFRPGPTEAELARNMWSEKRSTLVEKVGWYYTTARSNRVLDIRRVNTCASQLQMHPDFLRCCLPPHPIRSTPCPPMTHSRRSLTRVC